MRSKPVAGRALYWSEEDLRLKPYGKFWTRSMAPLPEVTRTALHNGPVAEALLPPLADVPTALAEESSAIENGFCFAADGSMRIAARTEMPGVTPEMVDWWFGWHSDSPERYKLWHPHAHVHAMWQSPPPEGSTGRARYVGNTSIVDEYLGSNLLRAAVRFVPPSQLGFAPSASDPARATIIAARTGLYELPVDVGYLVHEVRRVAGGSVMRSRFWMGGSYVAGRSKLGSVLSAVAARLPAFGEADARALLVHDAQEMQHLVGILPGLYAEFGES